MLEVPDWLKSQNKDHKPTPPQELESNQSFDVNHQNTLAIHDELLRLLTKL
jgi:hypothetical protein